LERDEKAFTYIKCYVSDPCMSMIRDEQHAWQAWKILSGHFIGKDTQDIHLLHSTLHRYQLDNTKPLEPQFQEMRDMCTHLASLGQQIDEPDFLTDVIQSLPSSYHNLKSFALIHMKGSNPLDSITFIKHVLQEEKLCKSDPTLATMFANTGKPEHREVKLIEV
jgi:hypothetical protein